MGLKCRVRARSKGSRRRVVTDRHQAPGSDLYATGGGQRTRHRDVIALAVSRPRRVAIVGTPNGVAVLRPCDGLRPSSSTSGPDIQFGQLSLCFAVLTLATATGGNCLVCRAGDYSAPSGCSRSVPRRPRIQTTMITMPMVNATVPRTPASTPYGRPVQRVVELPLGARTTTDP